MTDENLSIASYKRMYGGACEGHSHLEVPQEYFCHHFSDTLEASILLYATIFSQRRLYQSFRPYRLLRMLRYSFSQFLQKASNVDRVPFSAFFCHSTDQSFLRLMLLNPDWQASDRRNTRKPATAKYTKSRSLLFLLKEDSARLYIFEISVSIYWRKSSSHPLKELLLNIFCTGSPFFFQQIHHISIEVGKVSLLVFNFLSQIFL